MSHPTENVPTFKITVDEPLQSYYNGQRPPRMQRQPPQQWNMSRSRSVQYNVPSPSASVRSNNTAPLQTSFDGARFQQSSMLSTDIPVDPSIISAGLSPFNSPGHASRGAFAQDQDPWNPCNMRSGTNGQLSPLDANYRKYPNGPGSTGSFAPRSDSGYQSQSVLSTDINGLSTDLPSTVISQRNNAHADSTTVSEAAVMARVRSDQRSQVSSRSGTQGKTFECPMCSVISKCKSDYKKHMLRHEKPFSCDIPYCKRAGKGFTTINDLDRHKKSVHRLNVEENSYQCASELCRNKEKIWPRLDNFKQHIDRMHKDEQDQVDLIKRSVYKPRPKPVIQENSAIDPMETMLSGTGKIFSNQNNYCPDTENAQWPTNINPAELGSDLHRASITSSHLTLNANSTWEGSPQRCDDTAYTPKAQRQPQRLHQNLQQKNARPRLSRAPQTKAQQSQAQQQRTALSKFSNAVSMDNGGSTSKPLDLEQSILRILSTTANIDDMENDDLGPPFLTKAEAIKAVQAISNLIKQSPGSSYAQPRRVNQGFSADSQVCNICDYAVSRACDLRKHMKRHEKPYGCTYPKCHKRFGAKSDWKRHENSQHFQLEAYRCRIIVDGKQCGKYYLRVKEFQEHLTAHMMAPERILEEVKRRKIGKNGQYQFWCGFCEDIIPLKCKRNAAWDERFDHIAEHFQKNKEKIEKWVCAEENKTKQELLRDIDRYVFDDEEDGEAKEKGQEADAMGEADNDDDDEYAGAQSNTPQASQQPDRKKRKASTQTPFQSLEPDSKRVQTSGSNGPLYPDNSSGTLVTERYCCQCGYGPHENWQPGCMNCSQPFCSSCTTEEVAIPDGDISSRQN